MGENGPEGGDRMNDPEERQFMHCGRRRYYMRLVLESAHSAASSQFEREDRTDSRWFTARTRTAANDDPAERSKSVYPIRLPQGSRSAALIDARDGEATAAEQPG